MEKYEGVEWCPHCEDETEYNVDKNTWIVTCKQCGRPLVLCDKCYTMNGSDQHCGDCEHCKKTDELTKDWKKNVIGKRVYWNDPDDGLCSCFCTIVGFDDDHSKIHLRNDAGGFIDAYENEIDWKKTA